jgi:hypothetical protein
VRNPDGRVSAGLSIREWINQMQDWSCERIQKVFDDPKTPVVQKCAARVWLHAIADDHRAGAEFDRICDRTEGKPVESRKIVADVKHTTVGQTGIDYGTLTDDELAELDTLAERVASRLAAN